MTSLLGIDEQAREWSAAVAGGRMHHGWIFGGPKGTGKASFARAAAIRLLAEAAGDPVSAPWPEVPDDHPTARLIASSAHPDYVELQRTEKESGDLARNIGIDQVRGLQRLLGNAPALSSRRVVLIDSADDLERNGANALLKSLEEPPAGTVFILVAHAPSRLLPTIRSRCRILRFPPLSDAIVRSILKTRLPANTEEAEIEALIAMGEGSPGRALHLAGLRVDDMMRTLAAIAADGDHDNRQRLMLSKALSGKPARDRYEAFLESAPAFLADMARKSPTRALSPVLTAWEQARQLAASAVILSLDPATVVFELCSLVADLATEPAAA